MNHLQQSLLRLIRRYDALDYTQRQTTRGKLLYVRMQRINAKLLGQP